MYARLAAYKKEQRHCNVPLKWKSDPTLGSWVNKQRNIKRRLLPERLQRLDALGFDWDQSSTYWEQMYAQLTAYKKEHKHCNVPHLWEQDRALGGWVAKQRQRRTNDQLSPERICRLDALGFDWDPSSTYWEQMYARLTAYKKGHKHCNVPHLWEQDRGLGSWVAVQRRRRTNDQLSPERIRRLDALGFAWRIR
jgi:hypothetical protein